MALTEEEKKKAIEEYERKQKIVASSKKSEATASEKKKPQDAGNVNLKNTTTSKNTTSSKTSANSKTETKKEYDYTPAAQKRKQQVSESIAVKSAPEKFSAKAISSESDKYVPAAQQRKQATSDQIYENVLKGEAYLQSEGDGLAKGFINRARSVPGEMVENLAYLVHDFAPNYTPAKNVVENRYAGKIGDVATAQFERAKENTGDFGDLLVDAVNGGANLAPYVAISAITGNPTIGLKLMSVSGGLDEYRRSRESGDSKAEALFRGAGTGYASYKLEKLGGVFGVKNSIVKAVVPGTNQVSTTGFLSYLSNVGKNAFEEGGEEAAEDLVSGVVDVLADMIFDGEITVDFALIDTIRNSAVASIIGASFGASDISPLINSDPNAKTYVPAEAPVSPAETPIAEAENVTPETANEQEGAFANVGETNANKSLAKGIFDKKIGTSGNLATQEDINNYVDYSFEYSDKAKQDPEHLPEKQIGQIKYGKTNDRLVNDIENIYGVDVDGYYHTLVDNDIRHIKNSHGEGTNEKYPITAEDIKQIPDIVNNYDNVYVVTKENGSQGIYYEKRHNGTTYYLEAIKEGNTLANKQMIKVGTGDIPDIAGLKEEIKKRRTPPAPSGDKPLGYTSETAWEDRSSNNNIPQDNDVVKNENLGAQPNAQSNVPQEMVVPKNKVIKVTPKKVDVKAKITTDPESETEYINEEDYDGAQTNGNFGKNTVGSAQLNNTFYKSLDKFGAQPLRKEQIASGNEMRVPKKISENEAITENVGYMLGSKLADNDYMDDVIQHPEKYAHIINTDANSMQNAIDYIQNNGLDETYGAWRKTIDEHKMVEKDDISKAYLLGLFYQNKAKSETDPVKKEEYRHRALDIKRDINYAASKGGQLMQGIQMLQKVVGLDSINLKEDGEYMARGLVEKLNEDRKGKGKEIVLNEKLLKKAIEAAGTDAEGKAWDEVYKDLANQTSTNFWQRVNNYRYWCMLSNPRTHVRNIMSNVSMAIVNALKDATAKPIVEGLFNAYAKNRSNKAVELDSKIKQLIVDQKKTGAKDNSAEIEKLKKRAERLHGFDNARKKTVAFYSPKDLKFAIKDFKTAKLVFDKSAGKYQENTNSFIKEHKTNQNALITDRLAKKIEGNTKAGKAIKTILEHGVFGSVMDFNSWLLTDVEDGSFKAITYAHELAQRMSANGITPETASRPENIKKMDELRAEAFAEALYNTFNEDSKTADALRKLEETGVIPHVIVESLLPFKKVPVNIIKAGRDYSPIGVAKGIGEMAKVLRDPKAGDPGKAINDIAKGLTGLELMVIGGFLRSIGKITNGLSDDENEKNYQKLLGEQAFALKFSDGSSYTIDWLGAPVMPLFVGALIQDMKDGKLKEKIDFKKEDGSFDFEEAISVFGGGTVGVLSSIANPMIEMSMLQNIEYTLTSQYNSFGDFAIDAFGNYANQFVPQVLAAITKVKDNTKRNAYYVDKTDKMSDVFQVPVQVAMSKIPGLSEKLPEKVDAWGRTQKNSERKTMVGRAFDAFISPGTYKTNKTTEADKFLLSAFDGDASVMPKMQEKYFKIDKQRKDLSAQEYVDLQKEYGKQAQTLINQLIPNKATFNKLPDELQHKVIDDVYSYASQKGKEKVTLDEARKYAADKWVEDADFYAKEDGKPVAETIMERKVIGQYTKKDEQIAALEKTFGLSGNELHESYYKAKGEWNDNIQDVIAGGTSRQARVDAFKKRKWSDEDIILGYNGLMGNGNAKKAEQIAILTEVFGSKAKATEFYNIKEGNKGYK